MKCPNCATENRESAKFCDECGTPLTGLVKEPAAVEELSAAKTMQITLEAEPESDEAPVDDSAAEEIEPEAAPDAEIPSSDEQLDEQATELDDSSSDTEDPTGDIEAPVEGEDEPQEDVEEVIDEEDPDDIETDFDAYAPGATTIDFAGFDESVFEDVTGIMAPLTDEVIKLHDGATMEMPRVDDAPAQKSRNFKASATAAPDTTRRNRMLAILGVLLLIGAIAFVTYQMELWGGKSVPNVVEMTEADAKSVLSEQGFIVRSTQVKSDDTEGLVLVMDPSAGARLNKGEEVVIHIATARSIPDIIGKTEAQAIAAFNVEGYENVTYVKESSDKTEGTILSVDPEVGTRAKKATAITVKVAQPYRVPSIADMYLEDAQNAIEEAGLVPEISIVYTEDYGDGLIIGTDPAVDTKVEGGSTVYIQIARSRAKELETAANSYLVPGGSIAIGMVNYQIESVDSLKYIGNDTVSYSMTAKPYMTMFGETVYFSTQTITGEIMFSDSNEVIGIS